MSSFEQYRKYELTLYSLYKSLSLYVSTSDISIIMQSAIHNPKFKMLESERDIEVAVPPTTASPPQVIDDEIRMRKKLVTIGILCVINFMFSVDCNYRTGQYLLNNSILYVLFVLNRQEDLKLFTRNYLITVLVLYVITTLVQVMPQNCPKTQQPTQQPTQQFNSTI